MSVTIYSWRDGLAALRPAWIELMTSLGLNPSLHPDWLDITVSSHGLDARALIAAIKTSSGDEAIVPIFRRRISVAGVPLRCLDLCSNVVSYHAALIASGSQQRIISEIMNSRELAGWDVLRLGNLVTAESTATAADSLGASEANLLSYAEEKSPYVSIKGDWPSYLTTLSKKTRANIKRCIAQMQQAGETSMNWYEDDADTGALLAAILEVESRSWKASDKKAIRADAIEGDYYRRLLPWLARNGLMANVLYVKEMPVAYVLCAKWRGWVGQLKTSFAIDVKDAGFRVIQASLERAYQSGSEREYDFLGDAAPHKLRWTEQIRAHESKWLFARHLRGRALLKFKRAVDEWKYRRQASARAAAPTE